MCGIVGFMEVDRRSSQEELASTIRKLSDTLAHRGPDDCGEWVDAAAGIALGHRRLSIIDLSPHGHQPMASASGRYQLVYNGEIYNHADLRQELVAHGHRFRGHSDTEVLVEAIDCWGLVETLKRSIGMFALAVWDSAERQLTLARDRVGIKPLYYGWSDGVFLFGSELKALRLHDRFQNDINRDAIAMLLQHCYIPAPHSIYRGIQKLMPGCVLEIRQDSFTREAVPVPYWSMEDAVCRGRDIPFSGSPADAVDELHRVLLDSVKIRMEADVPLGAFLSGGIDSSLVVALMQSQSPRPIRTFSIGFHERDYNEAHYAAAVASHLGTEHTEHIVTPQEALDVIPSLPVMFDEPFADSSQIPTYLVSKITKQHVTVSLSGDGGDELFGGYSRYAHMVGIWNKVAWMPPRLRSWAANLLQIAVPWRGEGARRLLRTPHQQALYAWLNTHWKDVEKIVIGSRVPDSGLHQYDRWSHRSDFVEQMMHLDCVTYLPDDILTKVDRASMAVSLEARVPLLDHRAIELAWSLPLSFKIRSGQTKFPLRQILSQYVPPQLFERPKVGFGVPIDQWLRGPLRSWAEDLLAEDLLRRQGLFDPASIRRRWREHLDGKTNWHYWLWDVLMVQAWMNYYHNS